MEFEHVNKVTKRRAAVLHQGDDQFLFNRIISRNSSVGCSSRVFYYRGNEGVPFQWEMQPGTPKCPAREEILPPLSPPPALLSSGLPKPFIGIDQPKKTSIRSRLKFWKHIKKTQQRSHHLRTADQTANGSDKFEFFSSDGEFMASPPRNSLASFSSVSSRSFSNGHSRQSSRLEYSPGRPTQGSCPWNFTSILVCVARQI